MHQGRDYQRLIALCGGLLVSLNFFHGETFGLWRWACTLRRISLVEAAYTTYAHHDSQCEHTEHTRVWLGRLSFQHETHFFRILSFMVFERWGGRGGCRFVWRGKLLHLLLLILCRFFGEKIFEVLELSFEDLVFGWEGRIVKLEPRALFDRSIKLELDGLGLILFLLARADSSISIFLFSQGSRVQLITKQQALVVIVGISFLE